MGLSSIVPASVTQYLYDLLDLARTLPQTIWTDPPVRLCSNDALLVCLCGLSFWEQADLRLSQVLSDQFLEEVLTGMNMCAQNAMEESAAMKQAGNVNWCVVSLFCFSTFAHYDRRWKPMEAAIANIQWLLPRKRSAILRLPRRDQAYKLLLYVDPIGLTTVSGTLCTSIDLSPHNLQVSCRMALFARTGRILHWKARDLPPFEPVQSTLRPTPPHHQRSSGWLVSEMLCAYGIERVSPDPTVWSSECCLIIGTYQMVW